MNPQDISRARRPRVRTPQRSRPSFEQLEGRRLLATLYVNVGNTSGVENGSAASPYRTIQAAITNSAPSGDTIQIAAGTYAEALTVNHPVTLLGPDANIDPNTGTRGPEAVIVPPVNNPGAGRNVLVTGSGVTINGLTIDGDNPGLPTGTLLNGVSANAASGVSNVDTAGNQSVISNLTVTDDVIRNFTAFGVILDINDYSSATFPVSSGNTISHNKIDNMPLSSPAPGRGISIEDNGYADVVSNVITRTATGIQAIFMLSPTTTGQASVISGNTVSEYNLGIYLWNLDSGAPAFTVSNNSVSAATDGNATPTNVGIKLYKIFDGTGVSLSGNNVSGAHTGMEFDSVSNSQPVVVTGGTLSGNAVGLEVSNAKPPSGVTRPVQVSLQGVTVTNSTSEGLLVTDALSKSAAPVSLIVDASTTVTGSPHGVVLSGPYAQLSDAGKPVVTYTSTPPSQSTSSSATFVFTAADHVSSPNDIVLKYQLDGGSSTAAASPLTLNGLANGAHTLIVSATDQAGNAASASYAWTVSGGVDTPTVTAKETPASLKANTGKVTVTVSGTITDLGSTIVGASYSVVDSYGVTQPSGTITVKANGTYSFKMSLSTTDVQWQKRTYTVTVKAKNALGQTGSVTTTVAVV